jgi:hypothetical protein
MDADDLQVGGATMVDFSVSCVSLGDKRWSELKGGYRIPFDPRPLLARLETGQDVAAAWEGLWEELHHQGDVGEASYAAVPHLVRIHRQRGVADWNTYAIVAIIELARDQRGNPEVPSWLAEDYFRAIRELAEIGTAEVLRVKEPDNIRFMLSVIATVRGARTHGRFLVKYSEEELLEIESRLSLGQD